MPVNKLLTTYESWVAILTMIPNSAAQSSTLTFFHNAILFKDPTNNVKYNPPHFLIYVTQMF